MSLDHLFDIKNSFYLGLYQQCINEAQKFNAKSEEEKVTKQVYMYRAYIAQGKATVPLCEIPESTTSTVYKAIRRLAEFQNPTLRTRIIAEVESEVAAGTLPVDNTSCIVAAIILNQCGNPEDALRTLFKCDSLETRAVAVQTLLKMDRVDLAIKEIKKMNEIDEDATLTQLALAWVNMAVGKEKLKDAFYIYQEMMEKYGQSPLLLIGQASALIMQEMYKEADGLLQEAQQRDANNAEALINLIVVSEKLGKEPEVSNRYIAQMRNSHPTHPWSRDLQAKEDLFDKISIESSA